LTGRPVEVRAELRPRWPLVLPYATRDGVVRRRGAWLVRLLHHRDEPVSVAARLEGAGVVLLARAATPAAAEHGIARVRFALGIDDDLRPFHQAFRRDPLLGRALRAHPALRVARRAEPWEALAWAVTEQLIELDRALAIQRRMVAALGRPCGETGLRDVPAPAVVTGTAPALLEAMGLAAGRALALRRAAREVAAGRADLHAADPAPAERRLRAIPGIGRWTLDMLALHGQGRHDRIPAGDLGYLKLVGRHLTGRPRARADEAEVRGLFERYAPWQGLAGTYFTWAAWRGLLSAPPSAAPRPAGTRWSAAARRSAAA
jgi:3-methyladenine DNA glycosylase/8-oxoguanine DNA glycosylase